MLQFIIDHLWQSTLFAGLMALLTLAFTANGAHVRFCLWLAASLKFLIPFPLIVAAGRSLRWRTAPVIPHASHWPTLVENIVAAASSAPLPPMPPVALTATSVVTSGWNLASILAAIWACGVAVLLLRWTVHWFRLRAVLRASTRESIAADIPVVSAPALFEPGLIGLFRPVLMLPEGIAARVTPEQLQLIIAHELCHYRRRDNLTAALHMLVQAVFWFHPLVWWIGTRLVAERERACDENVIANNRDPKAYAESILEVCRFYVRSPLACASGVSGASLKHRVERIMINPAVLRLSRAKLSLLTVIAAMTVAVPLATGLLFSQKAVAQAQSVPPAPRPDLNAASRMTASPGTEALLRRHIGSMEKGQPDYEDMAPGLEQVVRTQLPEALPRFQKLGALISLTFKNVGPGDMDIYEAAFEKGRVEFRIAPLQPDGKVAGLGYQILPTPEEEAAIKQHIAAGKPDPERAVLLRRLAAANLKGEPNFEDMAPGLIEATKQQWPMISRDGKRLGVLKKLNFLYVNQRGWDGYQAVFENGYGVYQVGPLTDDHKLQGVVFQP